MRETSPVNSVLVAACLALFVMPGCGAEESADATGTDSADSTTETADATSVTDTTDDTNEDATDEANEDANEDEADEATDTPDDIAVEEPAVDEELTWGVECTEHSDCPEPTNMCAKQPNTPTGYCSTHCGSTSECHDNGAPTDTWTCNAVICSIPAMTWCGPTTELEEFNGFLSECE
tara:strand:- start:39 stop:572 length:534 start_codon:yes stop_codon:yes gene_type:complete